MTSVVTKSTWTRNVGWSVCAAGAAGAGVPAWAHKPAVSSTSQTVDDNPVIFFNFIALIIPRPYARRPPPDRQLRGPATPKNRELQNLELIAPVRKPEVFVCRAGVAGGDGAPGGRLRPSSQVGITATADWSRPQLR